MTPKATVVLLVYNGEEYLEACVEAVESQIVPFDFEVLAIDSGSTDRSLDILRAHPRVRLHQIPNSEFGHGRTRNLGASLAEGDFIVFLVQDAVPASPFWLARMVEPFFMSERVGCVYGRQIPRPDCCTAVKQDIHRYFRLLGDDTALRIDQYTDGTGPLPDESRSRFFSDVNSAILRSAWVECAFRDIPFAEDQALARDLMARGWLKVYTPFGAVYHSHDLGLRPYYRRMTEEWSALRSLGDEPYPGAVSFSLGLLRLALRNIFGAARDPDYGPAKKLREVLTAPAFAIARYVSILTSRRSRE